MPRSGFDGFRLSLALSRERGAPFPRAWRIAMRRTHPKGVIYAALKETKPEWQAAYERQPATSREAALAWLSGWLNHMP
jgi:hypothetical protein